MHNSNKVTTNKNSLFQKTSVKVVFSCLLFICFVFLITYVLFYPYAKIYSNDNQFELIVVGASEALFGADPEILSAETGMKTCILASERCDYAGKYEMLQAAIQQKSLKLVILDVSNTSLVKELNPLKELYITKISGLQNKLGTIKRRFSFWEDEYDTVFAEILNSGLKTWGSILDGSYNTLLQRRGYEPQYANTLTNSPEDIVGMRDFSNTDLDFDMSVMQEIINIIDLCRENKVEIVLITFPVSEQYIWLFSGWDKFHGIISSFATEYQVPYYDFNLLKNRYYYLSDSSCFRDLEHLNATGASAFSRMLANLITYKRIGMNDPFEFYEYYEEAKNYSYYSQLSPYSQPVPDNYDSPIPG